MSKMDDISQLSERSINLAKYEQLISWQTTIDSFQQELLNKRRQSLLAVIDEYILLLNCIVTQYKSQLPNFVIATCAQVVADFSLLRQKELDEDELDIALQLSISKLESIESDISAKEWLGLEHITKPSAHAKKHLSTLYAMNILQGDFNVDLLPRIILVLQKQLVGFAKKETLYNNYKKIIKDIQTSASTEDVQQKINKYIEYSQTHCPEIASSLLVVNSELIKQNMMGSNDVSLIRLEDISKKISTRINKIEAENTEIQAHVVNCLNEQINENNKITRHTASQKSTLDKFIIKIKEINIFQDIDDVRVKISAAFEDERKILLQANVTAQSKKMRSENKKIINVLSNTKAVLIADRTLYNDYVNNQRSIIIQLIKDAIEKYQASAFMSIHEHRTGVDGEGGEKYRLIDEIEKSQTSLQAAKCLARAINEVTADHENKSLFNSVLFIQRRSRMATALRAVQEDLQHKKLLPNIGEPQFLKIIRQQIDLYKSDDLFFHNRKRLRKANQLLIELATIDARDDKGLTEKQENIKDALENCINGIVSDYESNYITKITCYLWDRQSRLVMHLRAAQSQLVSAKLIPEYSYSEFVKPIICSHLRIIACNLKKSFVFPAGNIEREIDELISEVVGTVYSAVTPVAAETILKTTIIRLKQDADEQWFDRYRKDLADKLVMLLNLLQQAQLLTVSSEFADFLNGMGKGGQENLDMRMKLEKEIGIKLPNDPKKMREYVALTSAHAETLKEMKAKLLK